jgi:hypothetical protein
MDLEFDCPFPQYFTKAILLGAVRELATFYVMRISGRDKIVCCKHRNKI